MDGRDNVRERLEATAQQTAQWQRQVRWWRGIACGVGLLSLVSLPLSSSTAEDAYMERESKSLQRRVERLERTVMALQDKLAPFTVDASKQEVVISGVNLRLVNGLGITETTNGLGNLIVGYNEERLVGGDKRTGSHNVVVGKHHNFSSFGGLAVGLYNEISGPFASVSGGRGNTAKGLATSVSGGELNTAGVTDSAVCGGSNNGASGDHATVCGGSSNRARGRNATVSGGFGNTADGVDSAVSGGVENTAMGGGSAVSGGIKNTARGTLSSVSGGNSRTAPGEFDWVAGDLFADQ